MMLNLFFRGIPLFIASIAGILAAYQLPVLVVWAVFILAALIQNVVIEREKRG